MYKLFSCQSVLEIRFAVKAHGGAKSFKECSETARSHSIVRLGHQYVFIFRHDNRSSLGSKYHISICDWKSSGNNPNRTSSKKVESKEYCCCIGEQTILQHIIKESQESPGKCSPARTTSDSQQSRYHYIMSQIK